MPHRWRRHRVDRSPHRARKWQAIEQWSGSDWCFGTWAKARARLVVKFVFIRTGQTRQARCLLESVTRLPGSVADLRSRQRRAPQAQSRLRPFSSDGWRRGHPPGPLLRPFRPSIASPEVGGGRVSASLTSARSSLFLFVIGRDPRRAPTLRLCALGSRGKQRTARDTRGLPSGGSPRAPRSPNGATQNNGTFAGSFAAPATTVSWASIPTAVHVCGFILHLPSGADRSWPAESPGRFVGKRISTIANSRR